MNRLLFIIFVGAVCMADAATVGKVICRQQWPWSANINVEYQLHDVAAPVDIVVQCFNGDEELDYGEMHNAISGEVFNVKSSGVKRFSIDPVKAFGDTDVKIENFNVRLTAVAAEADYDEVLYRVYDLTGTRPYKYTDITREDLMNGKYGSYETDYSRIGSGFNTTLPNVLIWTAVTNGTEYKTDKLVMRKIPAADVVWTIGAPEDEFSSNYSDRNGRETRHAVKLTEDYFICVFEITQSQAQKIFPNVASLSDSTVFFGDLPDSAMRPHTGLDYNNIRGQTTWGVQGGNSAPKINWPTNSPMHIVYYNRFAGVMRDAMGKRGFDLPTEAQWEFACRAGTSTGLNSGKQVTTVDVGKRCPNVDEVAWNVYSDYSNAPGGTNQTREVGLKKPNAFGLYDMHGNAEELCLDAYSHDISVFYDGSADVAHVDPLVDPVGPVGSDKPIRASRGGCFSHNNRYIRSAYRRSWSQSQEFSFLGFRMVCPVGDDWEK